MSTEAHLLPSFGVGLSLWRVKAATATALLAGAAVLLMARRVAGALATPVEWPYTLAVSLGAVLLGLAAAGRGKPVAAGLLVPAAWVGVGAALWMPETTRSALVALWLPLASALLWHARDVLPPVRRTPRLQTGDALEPARRPAAVEDVEDPEPAEPEPSEDDRVVQHLTRFEADEGLDTLAGWVRARLAAGERNCGAHVAVCPPFAHVPRVEFVQLQGPEASVQLGQALASGFRFDLKLRRAPTEPTSVVIEFSATSAKGEGTIF